MKVRFGIALGIGQYSEATDLFRFLDESGFSILWIPDTQSLQRELYVSLAVAAFRTERITLGAGVTNPTTRHPAVTASAIASVDELSGGRAILSIGTGDSAVYNLGLKPARLETLEEYVLALRALWRHGETSYRGRTIRLVWAKRPVPVYIAAEGPRTLRLAGQIADGVIVGMGLTPEAIKAALEYLRLGAEEAGKRLEDLDVWWQAKWNIADSRTKAVEEIRMALAGSANHAFRFTLDGKYVPEEFHEPIRRLQEQYAFAEHEAYGAEKKNAQLVDELGLREYLAERFAIAGTVEDFLGRLEQLAALGVRQVRLSVGGKDRARLLRIVAKEIMPCLR